MKTTMRSFFLGFLAIPLLAVSLFGADATLRGVVTDTSGKPVRGAIVKATLGPKSISRFTQTDGRYEIPVTAGSYQMSVGCIRIRREVSDERHCPGRRHQLHSDTEMGRNAPDRRGHHAADPY